MTMTDLIPWRRRRNDLQVNRDRDLNDWAGSFHREMDHLMDRFFHGYDMVPFDWGDRYGTGDFLPKVDISETKKAIRVAVELPGMDEKDIELTLSHDSLTIKGEKKVESEENNKEFYRMERRYGSFHRVIPLGAEVDEAKAKADFKKGVLKITLPKTAQAQQAHKRIEIKAI